VGEILQRPPEFSALKVAGRRAYDLARAGRAVELAQRPVRIDRIDVLRYDWPYLELQIDCGSGTYIRSIARDLGDSLGCGGLIDVLVRTRIGPFTLERAISPADLTVESLPRHLRPELEALPELPRIPIRIGQVDDVASGRRLLASELDIASLPEGPVALIGPDGRLVALAESDARGGRIQPRKVFI
jgi:tRNA pseudouridine55 synthase